MYATLDDVPRWKRNAYREGAYHFTAPPVPTSAWNELGWINYIGDGFCPACTAIGDSFGPRHAGSPHCESGSLASGGKNAHCTCDTCF